MAVTYSIGTTAIDAGSVFAVKADILPDTAATPGGEANAMQANTQVLYKKPDGSQAWGTIDASRSKPGDGLVILPVGP